ncbi:hypothetical protein [Streptomyces sp. TE33382]
MSHREIAELARRDINTLYEPHPDRPAPGPSALRSWATGESEHDAHLELETVTGPELIPVPARAQMEGEAQVFAALLGAYGRHSPAVTGGPFGIAGVIPRPGELVIRVDAEQLHHWAQALAHAPAPGGRGVPHLRWATSGEDILLTLPGMRIVLAHTGPDTWRTALSTLTAPGEDHHAQARLPEAGTPALPTEHEHRDHTLAHLDALVPQLSATLRRVGLLRTVAARCGTLELLVTEHDGSRYLVDASGNSASVIPLWQSLSAPLELWPGAAEDSPTRRVDPRTAVIRAARTGGSPFTKQPWDTDAAQALCRLAGLQPHPLTLQAAEAALTAAEKVLPDPRFASLFDGAGWSGNCRRHEEGGTAHEPYRPALPPGAEDFLDRQDEDLRSLGELVRSDDLDCVRGPDGELEIDPAVWGLEAQVELLDWALAASTAIGPPLDETTRQSSLRAPAGVLDLELHDSDGAHSYTVQVISGDFAEEEYTVVWANQPAPSAGAAALMAQHAAIEAGPAMRHRRDSRKHRLLLPQEIADTAEPTIAELLLASDPHRCLTFAGMVEGLIRVSGRLFTSSGFSAGHWKRSDTHPEDTQDYLNSMSAYINEWCGMPSTHDGEAANTASVDSATYRRHLAAQRAAFDPFVTCYLAAAEETDEELDLNERHRAGVTALRQADLALLAEHYPWPVPPRLLELVASIPLDLYEVRDWYEAFLELE